MKQALIFSFLTLGSLTLKAQLFEEAQHALYNERFGTATAKFHQLIAQNPNNDAAWFGMAKAYHLQNKALKAADSLLLAPVQVKESAY
ncbi:MAG TPA: tetratricopeptide repeat protein, partial [Flavisolibacter sp.]|nr:tetratricopeptide repeat protein [Flavisolibacter sp.]